MKILVSAIIVTIALAPLQVDGYRLKREVDHEATVESSGGVGDVNSVSSELVSSKAHLAEESSPIGVASTDSAANYGYRGSVIDGAHEQGKLFHVTLTKEVKVPQPVPVPVPVEKKIPYLVYVPVHVKVDKPYPVKVYKPYPVPIYKNIPYKVYRDVKIPVKVGVEVPYPVRVPVLVPQPYPIYIHQTVPVPVIEKHYVKRPIILENEGAGDENIEGGFAGQGTHFGGLESNGGGGTQAINFAGGLNHQTATDAGVNYGGVSNDHHLHYGSQSSSLGATYPGEISGGTEPANEGSYNAVSAAIPSDHGSIDPQGIEDGEDQNEGELHGSETAQADSYNSGEAGKDLSSSEQEKSESSSTTQAVGSGISEAKNR